MCVGQKLAPEATSGEGRGEARAWWATSARDRRDSLADIMASH